MPMKIDLFSFGPITAALALILAPVAACLG
jgi:hypothetical protein